MLKHIAPNLKATDKYIYDIDIIYLKTKGFLGLILDIDNTIIGWGQKEVPEKSRLWIEKAQQEGFKIAFVSNAFPKKAERIAGYFHSPFISNARKPSKYGFKKALKALDLPAEKVVMIGDQLFTDIFGGNKIGLYTIWVKPMSNREFIFTKLTRVLEKITDKYIL